MTPSCAPARSFPCCPLSPALCAWAAPALQTRAFPVSAGDLGKQAASHGSTYLKQSHSTRPPAGKGGSSSSRGEPGASPGSSPSRAPAAAAPCPARASLRDPPRAPPPPQALGGRAASLPRPFVCRGRRGGGVLCDSERLPEQRRGWGGGRSGGRQRHGPRSSPAPWPVR